MLEYMKLSIFSKIARSVSRGVSFVYNKTQWFTDQDAWAMYRLFAICEAVGWTLLIGAIIYRKFDLPYDDLMVSIAGRIHGVFFALYFVFVLITVRSMMWGFWRTVGALVAGMPPYTSLAYEKIMAYHRKKYPKVVAPPESED